MVFHNILLVNLKKDGILAHHDMMNRVHNAIENKNYFVILSSRKYLPIISSIVKKYFLPEHSLYKLCFSTNTNSVIVLLHKSKITREQLSEYFESEVPEDASIITMTRADDESTIIAISGLLEEILDYHALFKTGEFIEDQSQR